MSLLSSIGKGLARAFTIPARERKVINANPLEPLVAQVISQEIQGLASQAIDKRVSDPGIAAALKVEVQSALGITGIGG